MKPELYLRPSVLEALESRIAPATIVVTSLSDSGPGSLRGAIDIANADDGADTIVFDKLIFGGTEPKQITLFSELVITSNLTIKGISDDLLTLSGNDASRIFKITDDNPNTQLKVSISGLTLADGKADGNGGAIYNEESLTLSASTLMNNVASKNGGALFSNSYGKLDIRGSLITGNIAQGDNSNGGGISAYTGSLSKGPKGLISITDTFVTNNEAKNGGGIFVQGSTFISNTPLTGGSIAISGGGISDNIAKVTGGGIFAGGGDMTIKGTEISGNQALRPPQPPAVGDPPVQPTRPSGGYGGGIYLDSGDHKVTIQTSLIDDNTAENEGGGIYSKVRELQITTKTVISDNTAINGGGMAIIGGLTTINSSTLSSNDATGDGGGIHATDFSTLSLVKTSLVGNDAVNRGGAIFGQGGGQDKPTLVLSSSIVSGNSSGLSGGGIDTSGVYDVRLEKTEITSNTSAMGGGAHILNADRLLIDSSEFNFNEATTGDGGGMQASDTRSITVNGGKFVGNTAEAGSGGGLDVNYSLVPPTGKFLGVNLTKTEFTSNGSANGGGVNIVGVKTVSMDSAKFTSNIADSEAPGEGNGGGAFFGENVVVTAIKSIFSKNAADQLGGGVYFSGGATSATSFKLEKGSFTENTADDGGAIFNAGASGAIIVDGTKFKKNLPNDIGQTA